MVFLIQFALVSLSKAEIAQAALVSAISAF